MMEGCSQTRPSQVTVLEADANWVLVQGKKGGVEWEL